MAEAAPAGDLACMGAMVEYCWRGDDYEAVVSRGDDGSFSYTVSRLVTDGDEVNMMDALASRATRIEVHSTEAVFCDVDSALSDARHAIVDSSQDDERQED